MNIDKELWALREQVKNWKETKWNSNGIPPFPVHIPVLEFLFHTFDTLSNMEDNLQFQREVRGTEETDK